MLKWLILSSLVSLQAYATSTRTVQADTIASPASLTKLLTFSFTGQTASTTLTLAPLSTTSQTLQIPNITGTDTIATLGLAQTFSATKTFSVVPTFSSLTTAGVLLNSASGVVSSSAGPLAVTNGGTGQSAALTQWGVAYASTTAAFAITPAGTAGQFLKSNGSSAPTWASPSVNYQQDVFLTTNSSTTAFTLSFTPISAASTLVMVDGVAQVVTTDYSVSGTTLTFTAAPTAGTSIIVYYTR